MKTLTKIFQVINFLFFVLCLLAVFTLGGAILGFVSTTIGIGILLLPILIGFILTILQLLKARREETRLTKMEKFLAVFPIVNFSIVVLLIISTFL